MQRGALFLALLSLLACYVVSGTAEEIVLPADLTRIESLTFAGVHTDLIRFPDNISYIAEDAFADAQFVGVGKLGSYADLWCREHGIKFLPDQPVSSVMMLALKAEGFAFSGRNAPENNPEGRMAHNIYMDPDLSDTSGKFTSFSIDFMAEDVAENTYWALCNWRMDTSSLESQYEVTDHGGAYAGLQVTGDGHVGIMSFWEIHYTKDGVNTVLNARRTYPTGDEHYFGGEGEGTNYIGPYPWKQNHWYRMTIACRDDESGNTVVEQTVQDLETGEWTLLSSFDTGLQHSYLMGSMSQFMENYAGDSSNEFRSFRFKNVSVQEYETQQWKPIHKATLSTDTWWDNKKGYYAFGSDTSSVWGITCGYGPDVVQTDPDIKTQLYCDLP